MYHYLGQAMLHEDQQKAVIDLEKFIAGCLLEKDTLAFASVTATTADVLFRKAK